MGYATVERTVTLQAGERQKLNVKMHQKDMELAEVKVGSQPRGPHQQIGIQRSGRRLERYGRTE